MRNDPDIFWLDDTRAFRPFFVKNNADKILKQIGKNFYDTTRLKENGELLIKNAQNFDIVRFLSFGVFKFMPDLARFYIYNDGAWFTKTVSVDKNTVINHVAPFYAFTHIANTRAQKPTFKFIHTDMTHRPYGIFSEGGGGRSVIIWATKLF